MRHRLRQIELRANGNTKALELHAAAGKAVDRFAAQFEADRKLRDRLRRRFRRVTRKDNVDFGGLARVSHATDATDWRVEFPFVVISPDTEDEVVDVVQACIDLGLTIIPRGGGTGYNGGAVPLDARSVVINTEKLDSLERRQSQRTPRCRVHGADGALRRRRGYAACVRAGRKTRRWCSRSTRLRRTRPASAATSR